MPGADPGPGGGGGSGGGDPGGGDPGGGDPGGGGDGAAAPSCAPGFQPDGNACRPALAVGGDHACRLLPNGSLWCWGANDSGQIGDGTFQTRPAAMQVGTATDWIAISAGDDVTCGIRAGGSLWCWGKLRQEFGSDQDDPGAIIVAEPTRVGDADGWTAVAAGMGRGGANGRRYSCGIRAGSLYCWGEGTLGNDLAGTSAIPVAMTDLTGWRQVAVQNQTGCAIREGGDLWCWGDGWRGEQRRVDRAAAADTHRRGHLAQRRHRRGLRVRCHHRRSPVLLGPERGGVRRRHRDPDADRARRRPELEAGGGVRVARLRRRCQRADVVLGLESGRADGPAPQRNRRRADRRGRGCRLGRWGSGTGTPARCAPAAASIAGAPTMPVRSATAPVATSMRPSGCSRLTPGAASRWARTTPARCAPTARSGGL